MAHFAKIENGNVANVIVVKNADCSGGDFPSSELSGQEFIASLGFDGQWLQTSYNKNFRGQFAGIGMFYDETLDCFHGESPYPSWILENDGLWHAPVPKPEDDKDWGWDEDSVSWVEIVP